MPAADVASREGESVRRHLSQASALPPPRGTEQSGRALLKAQLRDLWSERCGQSGRGWRAGGAGLPAVSGHTDRHGPHWRPPAPLQPQAPPDNHGPRRTPWVPPPAAGRAGRRGSHWLFGLEPRPTQMRNKGRFCKQRTTSGTNVYGPGRTHPLTVSCHTDMCSTRERYKNSNSPRILRCFPPDSYRIIYTRLKKRRK